MYNINRHWWKKNCSGRANGGVVADEMYYTDVIPGRVTRVIILYYTILYINYHYCYYCCYGDSNIMILRNSEYSFRVIVASERIDNGKGETHVLQFIIILDFYVHAIVALAATIGHCRQILKSVRVHRWHGKTLHIITRTCLLKEMFVIIYCTNAKKGKKTVTTKFSWL